MLLGFYGKQIKFLLKNKYYVKTEKTKEEFSPNKENWPSLEHQLTHLSKVKSGSELENELNQIRILDMLRPEEANDKIGLPLWLRIYWRKITLKENILRMILLVFTFVPA